MFYMIKNLEFKRSYFWKLILSRLFSLLDIKLIVWLLIKHICSLEKLKIAERKIRNALKVILAIKKPFEFFAYIVTKIWCKK